MKVMVTGGAGFVGSHLVRLLLEQGDEVRVLVRDLDRIENLQFPDDKLSLVQGDLRDPDSLKRAVQDCERVYHCAADYRLWTPHPEELYASNVEGTDSLLTICRHNGVEKVIYTSSVAAIGIPKDGRPGCEETPVKVADMIGHYKRSKFLGQQVALRHAAEGYSVIIVNPSTPVGPGDRKPTATGKIIVDFLRNRMPAFVDTGLNLVAVEDVARGHLLAADKGESGRPYILGEINLTLKEILALLAEITGLPKPRIQLPIQFVETMVRLENFFSIKLLKKEPMVPLEAVKMSRKRMWFTSERARTELGYSTTPVRAALARAVDFFVAAGMAPRPPQSQEWDG
jgi:dihydroflavonol-4-reductase